MHPNEEEINIGEFFGGGGGLSAGILKAFREHYKGIANHIFTVDTDSNACKTQLANNPGLIALNMDVCSLPLKALKQRIGNKRIGMMVGSPPCQGISQAGRTSSVPIETDIYYKYIIEAGKSFDASVILIENVPPVLTKLDDAGAPLIDGIVKCMKKNGYTTKWCVLNAKDYRVPQKRKRAFIIGFRDESDADAFEWPEPIHGFDASFGSIKQSDEEVEATIQENGYDVYMSPKKRAYYLNRKRELPNHVGFIEEDEVARTLRAGYMKSRGAEMLIHGRKRMRMLTTRECARLQTFPEDYVFVGSSSAVYRLLGNAVPVNLACEVAKSIINVMTKFEVEGILEHRVVRDGNFPEFMDYYVKWKGYGPHYDSWVKYEDLSCPECLAEYWKTH